jgi:predicted acetyltransferase
MREPRLLGRAVDEGAVSVRLASDFERTLIESLSQFYIYDFSEMEPPGSGEMEFGERGGYCPLPGIDRYWRVEGFRALLIRVKDRLAGFALINTLSRHGDNVEHNMAEFFVARKYRRRGVGVEAVRQILARYPGLWEIAVVERNFAARAFWPRAIGAAPNVSELVQTEGDSDCWRGPIWSFRSETDDARRDRCVMRRECDAGTIHSVGASRGSQR